MKVIKQLLVLVLCIPATVYSQDKLYRNNGEVINCKIIEETEENINLETTIKGRKISTSISKEKVDSIVYEKEIEKLDVGQLKWTDKGIIDDDGNTYIISKKANISENERSIFSINTIPEEQLEQAYQTYQSNDKLFRGIGFISNGLGYISGGLLGTGLYYWLDGQLYGDDINVDVGKYLMKYGGLGVLGTILIFTPIQLAIIKGSQKQIERDIIAPHNNIVNNSDKESAILKIELGIQQSTFVQAPGIKIVYRF